METTDIANKITVLDAVYIVKETWNEVNAETIRNCLWFHWKIWLKSWRKEDDVPEKQVDISDEVCRYWIDVDPRLSVAEVPTEE